MNLTLIRHAYLPDVTLGTLSVGSLKLATLEEGWAADPDGPGGQKREAGKRESCIPDGVGYTVRPHRSAKYPDGVWAIVNPEFGVYYQPGEIPAGQKWGRAAILIHAGNTVADIEGCCLVGRRHGRLAGVDAVLDSRAALQDLRDHLGLDQHVLTIRPTAGTQEKVA